MARTQAPQFRRILIIKPGAVGDLLQMTPVFRALKNAFRDASLTLLVGHASSAGLFQQSPSIDDVIVYDRTGVHRSLKAHFRLLRDLRQSRFDLVLNFQRSNIRTWLIVMALRPERVLVYHKSRAGNVHAVVNYLETLSPLGIGATDLALEFNPGEEAEQFARELFRKEGLDQGPVIALNPGATHEVNRWPVERFAELADQVQMKLHARAIIIGGPDDVELAGLISDRARTRPLSIAGTTTLPQLGAVLKRASALVSGDTGPMHMAAAVGTPVAALFGAADPARTGPVGTDHRVIQASHVPCVPCRSRRCGQKTYLECMMQITADRVLREVGLILAAGKNL